jgi:hypothetical protein
MIVIIGNQSSGKSSIALNIIKNFQKSMYFILDKDKTISSALSGSLIDFICLNSPIYIYDIEYRLVEKGVLQNPYTHIVVDPINFIETDKIETIFKKLEEIENIFNLEVIVVINTLNRADKYNKTINSLINKKYKVFNTNSLNSKKKQKMINLI